MAKQKTRAELIATNESLAKEIRGHVNHIEELEKSVERERRRFTDLLEDVSNVLRPAEYHITTEANVFDGTLNRERLHAMSVTAIFFRIGRLVLIEKEYEELKDRVLPLPKEKILEQENNQNRA